MDRVLVLAAQVAIAQGHRLEVTERLDGESGEQTLVGIIDLDTGIRYQHARSQHGELSRWIGRVLECTVILHGAGARTELTVDPISPGAPEAKAALRGADEAADAAKAEADRWGGTDRPPPAEPDRFW